MTGHVPSRRSADAVTDEKDEVTDHTPRNRGGRRGPDGERPAERRAPR